MVCVFVRQRGVWLTARGGCEDEERWREGARQCEGDVGVKVGGTARGGCGSEGQRNSVRGRYDARRARRRGADMGAKVGETARGRYE